MSFLSLFFFWVHIKLCLNIKKIRRYRWSCNKFQFWSLYLKDSILSIWLCEGKKQDIPVYLLAKPVNGTCVLVLKWLQAHIVLYPQPTNAAMVSHCSHRSHWKCSFVKRGHFYINKRMVWNENCKKNPKIDHIKGKSLLFRLWLNRKRKNSRCRKWKKHPCEKKDKGMGNKWCLNVETFDSAALITGIFCPDKGRHGLIWKGFFIFTS